MQTGFVYLDEVIPNIRWDAKYSGADNFVGHVIDGYRVNRVVGTTEMGNALTNAERLAEKNGLGLFLWDGYRPNRAVKCFVRWANTPENGQTKQKHYPNIRKEDIIPLGYVCEQSGHCHGSAIDVTLCRLSSGALLDMGGDIDLMDISSHHGASGVSFTASRNRSLLREIMEQSGFCAYSCEWWHYSLSDEPYPETVFDFPVE